MCREKGPVCSCSCADTTVAARPRNRDVSWSFMMLLTGNIRILYYKVWKPDDLDYLLVEVK